MPNDQEFSHHVVVTDIRMPFWSMVVFMVKFAIAAIPALLLLASMAAFVVALFGGVLGSIGRQDLRSSYVPSVTSPATIVAPREVPYSADVPDRCKGSNELEKCIARERALAQETPEERIRRQRLLEAERDANMQRTK